MPDDHRLRLGDTVEIDGETWVWEGVRRGTEAKLRRDGSADDWLILSVPELLSHAGTARRDTDLPLRPSEGGWPSDVRDMEKHLLEAFRGIPMDATASRWTRLRSASPRTPVLASSTTSPGSY